MGHRHFFVISLALLLVATTHAATAAAITQQGTNGVVGSMVESGPPNCEGMCGWWCVGSSCEAVLVPIEPPQKQYKPQSRRHGSGGDGSSASPAVQQQRPSSYDDDDHAEYKPVVWRCKCVGAS